MSTLFFGPSVRIARYDRQKYPILEKLTKQQLSYTWMPEEVDITKDASDFKKLDAVGQHIFTANIKRQIILDTKQGVAPSLAFLPIASLPELENWIQTWAFFETIHSRSYTHIIRNIYSNPSDVFDNILGIEEIANCARDISVHYDKLIQLNADSKSEAISDLTCRDDFDAEHAKALWLALNSVNILEGIRFYVSFACSWAFAEQKKMMEGNAKIIKFICRDENLHLASTQHLIKLLPKDAPYFVDVAKRCEDEVVSMFESAVDQERKWAEYLFKDGSMLGLNYEMLVQYVEWTANKRMNSLGIPSVYKGGANPLPWTQKWISGSEVQVAPQETELSSYIVGGVSRDVTNDTFKGFTL